MLNEDDKYSIESKKYQKQICIMFLNNINITKIIPKNSKIIDIGCATGDITFYVYNKLNNCDLIIGIDIDKNRINLAKEKYKNIEKLKFINSDAENIYNIITEKNFNLIFSSIVLHWIKNKKIVFENIYNLLGKEGYFISIYPHKLEYLRKRVHEYVFQNNIYNNEMYEFMNNYFLSTDETKYILENIGFKILKIEEEIMSLKFNCINDFLKWYEVSSNYFFKVSYLKDEQISELEKEESIMISNIIKIVAKK